MGLARVPMGAPCPAGVSQSGFGWTPLSSRYKGFRRLRAAAYASGPKALESLRPLSFSAVDELPADPSGARELGQAAADRAVGALGLGPAAGFEVGVDLALVHLAAADPVEALEALLERVLALPTPALEGLLVAVVLTCGEEAAMPGLLPGPESPQLPGPGGLSITRPMQSIEVLEGRPVGASIMRDHPALMVQWLPGVIRVDALDRLDPAGAAARGGGRFMLADRTLSELAYKLCCTYKYGA